MFDEHLSEKISLDSLIIKDRIRKDFGDIKSLAESISSVRLLQPVVINENNELIDGQRRIKAYIQLGIEEIPYYRVSLRQIILGEFHANSNRKDFTSSERVAISTAVGEFFSQRSKRVGRPKNVQQSGRTTINDSKLSLDSTNEGSENNVVNLSLAGQ
jgi:ParB family chromosome partitioning protein